MDKTLTINWLKCVWVHRLSGLRKQPSLLVLDSFWCHRMPYSQNEMKSDLVIIPGSITRLLQALDVTINKPLKDARGQLCNTWLSNNNHTYTAGGHMWQPTLTAVALSVWNELDTYIIKQGFLKCCISNKLDGREDENLWENKCTPMKMLMAISITIAAPLTAIDELYTSDSENEYYLTSWFFFQV